MIHFGLIQFRDEQTALTLVRNRNRESVLSTVSRQRALLADTKPLRRYAIISNEDRSVVDRWRKECALNKHVKQLQRNAFSHIIERMFDTVMEDLGTAMLDSDHPAMVLVLYGIDRDVQVSETRFMICAYDARHESIPLSTIYAFPIRDGIIDLPIYDPIEYKTWDEAIEGYRFFFDPRHTEESSDDSDDDSDEKKGDDSDEKKNSKEVNSKNKKVIIDIEDEDVAETSDDEPLVPVDVRRREVRFEERRDAPHSPIDKALEQIRNRQVNSLDSVVEDAESEDDALEQFRQEIVGSKRKRKVLKE